MQQLPKQVTYIKSPLIFTNSAQHMQTYFANALMSTQDSYFFKKKLVCVLKLVLWMTQCVCRSRLKPISPFNPCVKRQTEPQQSQQFSLQWSQRGKSLYWFNCMENYLASLHNPGTTELLHMVITSSRTTLTGASIGHWSSLTQPPTKRRTVCLSCFLSGVRPCHYSASLQQTQSTIRHCRNHSLSTLIGGCYCLQLKQLQKVSDARQDCRNIAGQS